jgi:hypothetical protein
MHSVSRPGTCILALGVCRHDSLKTKVYLHMYMTNCVHFPAREAGVPVHTFEHMSIHVCICSAYIISLIGATLGMILQVPIDGTTATQRQENRASLNSHRGGVTDSHVNMHHASVAQL